MASRITDDRIAEIIDHQRDVGGELLDLALEVRDRREVDKLMLNQRQQNVRWPGGRRRR